MSGLALEMVARFFLMMLVSFLSVTCVAVQSKETSHRENVEGSGKLPSLEQLVTSPFGTRNSQRKWRGTGFLRREHHGVDIKAPKGWPVISFRDGEVVQAGPSGAAGIIAKIRQSDGITVVYAHLDKVVVSMGQKVSQGQILGEVGCTGRTTGSHLHLAMRKEDNSLVDPLHYVKNTNEIFKPNPEQIPESISADACRRSFMSRRGYGRPIGIRNIRELENSLPPPIPVWPGP